MSTGVIEQELWAFLDWYHSNMCACICCFPPRQRIGSRGHAVLPTVRAGHCGSLSAVSHGVTTRVGDFIMVSVGHTDHDENYDVFRIPVHGIVPLQSAWVLVGFVGCCSVGDMAVHEVGAMYGCRCCVKVEALISRIVSSDPVNGPCSGSNDEQLSCKQQLLELHKVIFGLPPLILACNSLACIYLCLFCGDSRRPGVKSCTLRLGQRVQEFCSVGVFWEECFS